MVMAQNIPDLPTVSLDGEEEASCDLTSSKAQGKEVPAVYHDGLVPSPSLHLVHLFNDISDGSKVGTHPIR